MVAMPRPRPLHLHRETSRHGRTVWYVRIGKGPRIRLRAEFGSPEFEAEYHSAIGGNTPPAKAEPSAGTLGWLIARSRETSAWLKLAAATRRQRENIFRHVIAAAGTEPLSRITRETIVAGRERRSHTPYQARHFRAWGREQTAVAARAGSISTVSALVSLDNPYRK
jgi:hypothetical protein